MDYTLLAWILGFTVFSGVLSLFGGVILLVREKLARKISLYLVSFAVGALLGVSFLDLMPEALSMSNVENVLIYSLLAIIIFYLIEKSLIWHHHHTHVGKEFHSFNYLVLIGDTFHNFLDGVAVAITFLISIPLGIATSLAVFFHEIPQEMGDFSILLYGKMKRKKILGYNLLSSLTAIIGALITYFFFPTIQIFTPILLAFVAGAFIYIAASDMIPETREEKNLRRNIVQILLLVLGIFVIWISGMILG